MYEAFQNTIFVAFLEVKKIKRKLFLFYIFHQDIYVFKWLIAFDDLSMPERFFIY